jgi:hypothetical protein
MNFKLVSKNNVGVVLILLLVIFLSQNKTLNFLIDTYLGRIFLILILLIVSYCHKILGIVFVFLVIISFNYHNRYFEGLTTATQQTSASPENKDERREIVINDATLNAPKFNPNMITNTEMDQAALAQVVNTTPTTTTSTTTTPTTTTPTTTTSTTTTPTTTTPTTTTPTTSTTTTPTTTTTEGFSKNLTKGYQDIDIIGTEHAIKKGKQSNSIPVNSFSRSSDNVSAVDINTLFNHNFSTF